MPLGISNGVLNQKNAPAIYEDIYANRPAAGFSGRIFIATDTSQIFVDNGTSWVLIANTGIGSTGNLQVVTTNGNTTNTGISITAGGLATNAVQITGLSQAGGVLFTDGSGNLAQDVNFNWDATNNYLGIGQTGTPSAPLDIHNGTVGVQIQLNATSTNNSTIAFQNASVGKWRIGNLYSAGSNLFHIYNVTTASNALTISAANAATFIDSLTATSLIKSGGTSSQFLKADGSVDSSAYITLSSLSATTPLSYNNSTGAFTILQSGASQSGYLSSTDWNTFNNKQSALTNPITGTGTTGQIVKFTGTTQVGNSIIYENGNNIGITVTPNVWSAFSSLQLNTIGLSNVGGFSQVSNNIYYNGTNYIYQTSNGAGRIGFNVDGELFFANAPSGTAGNAATLTTRLSFNGTTGIASFYSSVFIGSYMMMNSNTTGLGQIGFNRNVNTGGVLDGTNGAYQLQNNAGRLEIQVYNGSGTQITPNAISINTSGNTLINNATDNGQGKLQNTGQTFTGGLGIGGLTFSTNTTASVNTSFYFFNGGAGVTLTLPDTNGQSMIYYIKNYSASPLTIARTGSNTFVAAGTIVTVTSLTLASGASTTIIGNGTTNYIQIQ